MNKHKKWVLNSVICLKMLYIITEGSVSNLFFFFYSLLHKINIWAFPTEKFLEHDVRALFLETYITILQCLLL